MVAEEIWEEEDMIAAAVKRNTIAVVKEEAVMVADYLLTAHHTCSY